jgi:hypothetical protein
MTAGNPQLQARGGKNYLGILGLISGVAVDAFKLLQNSQVVLEGDGKVTPGAASIGPSTDFLFIANNSGALLTFSLYLEQDAGGSQLLSSATIASGNSNTLNALGALFQLPKGSRLRLNVTGGSVTAGGGVSCLRNAAIFDEGFISAFSQALETTTFDVPVPPGASALAAIGSFINFAPSPSGDVTFDEYVVFADGTELKLNAAPIALAGGAANTGSGSTLGEGMKMRYKFSSLPPTSYIFAQGVLEFINNAFTIEPPIV